MQWRIQGRGQGGPGPPPLFLDQTEMRAEHFFFFFLETASPPPLSEGLNPPLNCIMFFALTNMLVNSVTTETLHFPRKAMLALGWKRRLQKIGLYR